MKKFILLFLLLGPVLVFSQYNVTFQVDLRTYTGSYGGVYLNGDFNTWCGTCAPMSDINNDSIYELTVLIPTDSMEYKFTLDGWTTEEILASGAPCTKTTGNFVNRFAELSSDTTLPQVCWEACTSCAGVTPTRNVTFQVDLSDYAGSYTEVNLNGEFNSWCGACATMVDPDNDSIYELTINTTADTIQYKFTLDGWTTEEIFVGGEPCTKTTGAFTNRMLLPSGDTTLQAVCWESCLGCNAIGITENSWIDVRFSPNPASDNLNIEGNISGSLISVLSITDLTGKAVLEQNLTGTELNHQVNLSGIENGVYLVSIKSDLGVYTEKIVIRN